MARIKYYYDTKTCNYERIRPSKWDILFDLLGYMTVSLVCATIIAVFYCTYFDSPKEEKLKQENEALRMHYEMMQEELNKSNEILAVLQDRDDNIYRTIFEAEPIPSSVRRAGVGGVDRYKNLTDKNPTIAHTMQQVDQLKRRLYIQTKSYDELSRLARDKIKRLAATPAIQPIANKNLKYVGSGFGMRLHPIYKVYRMHTGMDFSAPRGTPIYATGDGIAKVVKKSASYGNYVDINHGYGFVTRYAHMQSINVKLGQSIKRGECIGYVGSSGVSTAPHLHYEVIKHGKQVNPAHYFFNELNAAEYEELIRLASLKNQSLD